MKILVTNEDALLAIDQVRSHIDPSASHALQRLLEISTLDSGDDAAQEARHHLSLLAGYMAGLSMRASHNEKKSHRLKRIK